MFFFFLIVSRKVESALRLCIINSQAHLAVKMRGGGVGFYSLQFAHHLFPPPPTRPANIMFHFVWRSCCVLLDMPAGAHTRIKTGDGGAHARAT